MTNRSIKHFLAAFGLGCGIVAVTSSCSEWDDHFDNSAAGTANATTLWQAIQQRPELSDFRDVLESTKVFRHHKKTDISYASLLDGQQTFTVMAPVNGTFNKDSIMQLLQTDRGDSMVVRSFVGNHLSYNLANSQNTTGEFFLMNTKRATIGNNQVLNVPIREANIRARGGILHVMEKTLPYRHNLYEILLNDPRYELIGQQLSSYEEDEFSPTQSVEGGMVDGEQIYVDSVFIEHNRMLESVGRIADEDSTFIMLLPTGNEWQRIWQEAMSLYRYDSTVENADSLQRFWANHALLNDAIFSQTIQASPKDSLVTYAYNKKYPQYHVFHKPYDAGGILYGATPAEYSNGTLYTTEHWPFTPQTTFQREIKVEGEQTAMIIDHSACTYGSRTHAADSVSENQYLDIVPESGTSNWTMTFKLTNTLAGTYDICAVILPATVYDPNAQLKPNMFQAEINYVDENGKAKTFDCNKVKFNNNPERVDTLVLAENFTFPVCNYNQTNMKFSVKLKCSILARETRNYSREMFLDCIYLRPKKTITTNQ